MRNPQGKAVSAALRAGLIRTDSVHDSRREGRKPRLGVFELVAQVADSKASFPANVRELENVTERGFVLSLPGQGGANEDTAKRSAA
jgi:DNA-binding NtrC family response regulator